MAIEQSEQRLHGEGISIEKRIDVMANVVLGALSMRARGETSLTTEIDMGIGPDYSDDPSLSKLVYTINPDRGVIIE